MKKLCTVHQRLSDGLPLAHGSEVRSPGGEPLPGIVSVTIEAVAGTDMWETTIKLRTVFGEPIPLDAPIRG